MRKGLLIVGIVLAILGAIISLIPSTTTHHFAASSFGGSFGEWHFSDPISLPGGIGVSLSWNSNQVVTMGLASQAAVNAFQSGSTSTLNLLSVGSGQVGSFSATVPESGNYILAISVGPFFGTFTISVDITMTTPFAYAIIGVPILIVGVILLILGAALKAKAPLPAPLVTVQPPTYPQPPQARPAQHVQYRQLAPPPQPAAPQAPINPPAPAYQPPPVNPTAPQAPQRTPGTGAQFARSFCIRCGAPLPSGAGFCGACGAKIA